jgi:hypothetical protein
VVDRDETNYRELNWLLVLALVPKILEIQMWVESPTAHWNVACARIAVFRGATG